MRGPDGGATGAAFSERLGAGIASGVECPETDGDLIGALKLRLLLGPVGALNG